MKSANKIAAPVTYGFVKYAWYRTKDNKLVQCLSSVTDEAFDDPSVQSSSDIVEQVPAPKAMVLVYEPRLTHSIWLEYEWPARTLVIDQLRQGVREGRWVAWRLYHVDREETGVPYLSSEEEKPAKGKKKKTSKRSK